MDYEWDDLKRLSNLGKHGVDFDAMHRFQWETAIIDPDDRHDEPRWVARGFIGAVQGNRILSILEYLTQLNIAKIDNSLGNSEFVG